MFVSESVHGFEFQYNLAEEAEINDFNLLPSTSSEAELNAELRG